MLTETGLINDCGGDQFKGMARFDARVAIAKALEALGQLKGKSPNPMKIG